MKLPSRTRTRRSKPKPRATAGRSVDTSDDQQNGVVVTRGRRVMPWQFARPKELHEDFETGDDCEVEDRRRIASLRRDGRREAIALADILSAEVPKPTQASARFMRVARCRIILEALRILTKVAAGDLYFATIIVARWFFPVDTAKLEGVDIGKIQRGFIQHLNRAGGRESNGILIGRFEGALMDNSRDQQRGYHLHLHGVADARMEVVLRQMTEQVAYGDTDAVGQSVRLQPVTPGTTARVLGYSFKAQWRTRKGENGTAQSGATFLRDGGRLPEPHHTDALLWLHERKLANFTVAYGTRYLRRSTRMSWM